MNRQQFVKKFNESSRITLSNELAREIGKLTGVWLSFKVTLENIRSATYISVESNDISATMVPKMFEEIKVGNSGGDVCEDGSYWLPIQYFYRHFSRGSNGSNIATVWINQDGTIKSVQSELLTREEREAEMAEELAKEYAPLLTIEFKTSRYEYKRDFWTLEEFFNVYNEERAKRPRTRALKDMRKDFIKAAEKWIEENMHKPGEDFSKPKPGREQKEAS